MVEKLEPQLLIGVIIRETSSVPNGRASRPLSSPAGREATQSVLLRASIIVTSFLVL